MQKAELFQWVELKQDVPDSTVKKGDRGVVLDHLSPNSQQKEAGYTVEFFKDGETFDVVSVPISWIVPVSEFWGKPEAKKSVYTTKDILNTFPDSVIKSYTESYKDLASQISKSLEPNSYRSSLLPKSVLESVPKLYESKLINNSVLNTVTESHKNLASALSKILEQNPYQSKLLPESINKSVTIPITIPNEPRLIFDSVLANVTKSNKDLTSQLSKILKENNQSKFVSKTIIEPFTKTYQSSLLPNSVLASINQNQRLISPSLLQKPDWVNNFFVSDYNRINLQIDTLGKSIKGLVIQDSFFSYPSIINKLQETLKSLKYSSPVTLSVSFDSFTKSYFELLQISSIIQKKFPKEAFLNRASINFIKHIELTRPYYFLETEQTEQLNLNDEEIKNGKTSSDENTEIEILNKEKDGDIVALLKQINSSDLIIMWEGANEVLRSNNPDKARHCLSSLRELLNYILRRLAPDDNIRRWNDDPKFYYDNKPTRRTRLLYICRTINIPALSDFIEKSIKTILELFDILNEVHKVELPYTTAHLSALISRIESEIIYLIKISQGE